VKTPLRFEFGTRDPERLILAVSPEMDATLTIADWTSLETIVLAMNGLFWGS
jgi:hypothetical protein